MDLVYSIKEFESMKESLIGSLVCLYCQENASRTGRGILVNLRRERGSVYAKVAWSRSPFFKFYEERKIGWHSIERLFILQNKFGAKNYAYQSKDSQWE